MLLASAALFASLLASSDSRLPPVPPGVLSLSPRDSVIVDCDDAGNVYALGRTWKMTFGADGARYVPRFGQRAARTLPIHFAFPDAATPVLTGKRVTIDRGGFLENYDLAPESVEQSFTFARRPHDGDLVLRVPVASELASLPRDVRGLRYGRDDLGEVVYGDAVAIDAHGRRIAVTTIADAGAIVLTVPDSFLDGAAFPVVVDPLITTLAIDGGVDQTRNPDVAYSPIGNTFAVAYEEIISGNDTDVLQRRYDKDGVFLDELAVTIGNDDATAPAIAEHDGTFLIVWKSEAFIVATTRIKARNRNDFTGALGSIFDVSEAGASGVAEPDVGATDELIARPFVVVWQQAGTPDPDVACRQTSADGNLGAVTKFSAAGFDQRQPAVNQRAKAGGAWVLAWTSRLTATSDQEIVVQGLSTSGSPAGAFVASESPGEDHFAPDVAGDGFTFLVAWHAIGPGTDDDLHVRGAGFSTFVSDTTGETNLGTLDHAPGEATDQSAPAVGFDGARFLVAYSENKPGTLDTDVYATSVFVAGGEIHTLENHVPLAITAQSQASLAVASCGTIDPGKHFVAWSQDDGADEDVMGAVFSTLGAGGATTVQTGCGVLEPLFSTGDLVFPGGVLTAVVFNSSNPLLIVGLPTSVPLCPAGCTLGATMLLLAPVPTFFVIQVPADATLVGTTFAMQVLDLLPAGATGTLCGPPKFSQKFRVSDTRVITIQ